uniref:Uncharacterized protein n=1 Tax=Picea glauca TaxID=3330 RepID=A0A101M1D7_PICGL|nr:hypothetical protein ABT39_MTgene3676 [Picea glauca]
MIPLWESIQETSKMADSTVMSNRDTESNPAFVSL